MGMIIFSDAYILFTYAEYFIKVVLHGDLTITLGANFLHLSPNHTHSISLQLSFSICKMG